MTTSHPARYDSHPIRQRNSAVEGRPAVMLLPGLTRDAGPRVVRACLAADGTFEPIDDVWFMFGGNYVASSDGRWARTIAKMGTGASAAVLVFDRFEPSRMN
jgi:hypothetical protein